MIVIIIFPGKMRVNAFKEIKQRFEKYEQKKNKEYLKTNTYPG